MIWCTLGETGKNAVSFFFIRCLSSKDMSQFHNSKIKQLIQPICIYVPDCCFPLRGLNFAISKDIGVPLMKGIDPENIFDSFSVECYSIRVELNIEDLRQVEAPASHLFDAFVQSTGSKIPLKRQMETCGCILYRHFFIVRKCMYHVPE